MPQKNILLTAQDSMLDEIVPVAHDLAQLGYNLFATESTQEYLKDKGVKATLLSFSGEIVSIRFCCHLVVFGCYGLERVHWSIPCTTSIVGAMFVQSRVLSSADAQRLTTLARNVGTMSVKIPVGKSLECRAENCSEMITTTTFA